MATFPIVPFARWLIYATVVAWENWDSIVRLFGRADEHAGPLYGYHLKVVYQVKGTAGFAGPTEIAESGIHFVNITSDALDPTWTSGDFAAVESAFSTFFTAQASRFSPDFRVYAYRWYAFGPGITKPNPVARETILTTPIPGSGSTASPHQVATTVTLRTTLRKHWGRFYLPLSASQVNNAGQMDATNTDGICNAAVTFLHAAWTSNGILPVVYDRARTSVFGVTSIEVDSVPDIVRRRRPATTNYRKIVVS